MGKPDHDGLGHGAGQMEWLQRRPEGVAGDTVDREDPGDPTGVTARQLERDGHTGRPANDDAPINPGVVHDGEGILDVVCGDRDFWVISATQNIAHVKPAKEGAATNLNLVTVTGNVYSFMLREGRTPQPDLRLIVTADPSVPRGQPKYVPATQVNALQTELAETRQAIEAVSRRADETLASFRQAYPSSLQFAFGAKKQ